jgi:hypothetical protein
MDVFGKSVPLIASRVQRTAKDPRQNEDQKNARQPIEGRAPQSIVTQPVSYLLLPNTSLSKSVTRAAGFVRIFFSS